MSDTTETTVPQTDLIQKDCQICYHKETKTLWLQFPDGSHADLFGYLPTNTTVDKDKSEAEEFAEIIETFRESYSFIEGQIYPHGGTPELASAISKRDRTAIDAAIAKLPADDRETLTRISDLMLQMDKID